MSDGSNGLGGENGATSDSRVSYTEVRERQN